MNSVQISIEASVFETKKVPVEGKIVGYAALISHFDLKLPYPQVLTLIAHNNKKSSTSEWNIFPAIYQPEETVYKHLQFALKNEGIHLLFFKKFFQQIKTDELIQWVQNEPASIYARKIWFLYEFLMEERLPIEDADKKIKYADLIDEKHQYALDTGVKSSRHRIINNLPGTVQYCPMIFKTEKLENYLAENLALKQSRFVNAIHKDVLHRASAFLLLKDSKASFTIEGESPTNHRAMRWGKAIGQAGSRSLDKAEFVRLQQIVIENSRFVKMGFREEGGFVGEHDRSTGEPLPEHISARWQDLDLLVEGIIDAYQIMEEAQFNAILTAAKIAFGFVFVHPFVDGNGRIHRYLIHHILSKMKFAPQGMIFPVSASILNHIDDYRNTLESYSHPLLDFIEWKKTDTNNIEVLNETIDYYRYYDATRQAEFLFDCVNDTIEHVIPEEVNYLQHYDLMKRYLDDEFQMPDKAVSLLIRFLEQNNGKLSKRALEKEFSQLDEAEVEAIENHYRFYFEKEN